MGWLDNNDKPTKKIPADRIPPGQKVTEKFPVLSFGETPPVDLTAWDFQTTGLVEVPLKLDFQQFLALPQVKICSDFHCVTRWSRLDNLWEGVGFKTIVALTKPLPGAQFILLYSQDGYTTNLPLKEALNDDVLLAFRHDGHDLSPDHGGPLRLVVPKLYAWKSAKWIRKIEFMAKNKRGFWESNGYHNHADPWKEERYASDEEGDDI